MKNKKAFTLSEVLIALAVIGVIAAITIPSVKIQMEKQDTIAQLKVAYSLISQGVNRAWADYGPIYNWDVSLSPSEFGRLYVKPYFIYTKECTSMSDGCWETDGFNGYYDLSGVKKKNTVPYSLVLNNGMILGINQVAGVLLSYIIDINGSRKPNKMGRDIFSFYVYNTDYSFCNDAEVYTGKDGLYPGGYDNCGPPHAFYTRDELLSKSVCRACTKSTTGCSNGEDNERPGVGAACAAVIVKDGWQIKSDYPW